MISFLPKKERKDWMWCDPCSKFHLKWARHLKNYEKTEAITFPVYTARDERSGILYCYYVSIESIRSFFQYMKQIGENGHYTTKNWPK